MPQRVRAALPGHRRRGAVRPQLREVSEGRGRGVLRLASLLLPCSKSRATGAAALRWQAELSEEGAAGLCSGQHAPQRGSGGLTRRGSACAPGAARASAVGALAAYLQSAKGHAWGGGGAPRQARGTRGGELCGRLQVTLSSFLCVCSVLG